jgi:(1->4)-alpha-D-glucan 1-alpha-D-glucosylmutase
VTPRATYRLQFRNGVDFAAAATLAPYLARLGVSHLYASPIQAARPGSTHGYDVVDYNRLDPVLGGDEGFRVLSDALRSHGLGLILDIVPNHMAAAYENPLWRDVLAHGPSSAHARVFDIDWDRHGGKVLLPVLGGPYEEVLERGEIELRLDDETPVLTYYDRRFPIAPGTLDEEGAALDRAGLHALLERQHYRLAHWHAAFGNLNYRRFFDINDLVAVRVDDPKVFALTHALVLSLIGHGRVDGLRIDHVDGVADPTGYLQALHQAVEAAKPAEAQVPIWVEKILGPGEPLRHDWPIAGTTGYEFANQLTSLLVAGSPLPALVDSYRDFTGDRRSFTEVVDTAKRELLEVSFAAEWAALTDAAADLAEGSLATRDLTREMLRRAVAEMAVALPVYRLYVAGGAAGARDRALIEDAAARARTRLGAEGSGEVDFLADVLKGRTAVERAIGRRFQHLTGPLMAKAVEDTAFYRHVPLLALNEVGGEPDAVPLSIEAFHALNAARQRSWDRTLLATSTHDTKRGEDARVRLVQLAWSPDRFADAVCRWWNMLEPARTLVSQRWAPSEKEGWLFFQSLVGAWPPDLDPAGTAAMAAFAERLQAYMLKALREAKENTRWTDIDAEYEAAVGAYVAQALDPARSAAFLAEIRDFAAMLGERGEACSLVQLLIKLTAPGVPDLYQGTEDLDLSLVDPDNRRPVDFAAHRAEIDALEASSGRPVRLQGRFAKLALMHAVLDVRRAAPRLFANGAYVPLKTHGPGAERLLAYVRVVGRDAALVVAPLSGPNAAVGAELLVPPDIAKFDWQCMLSGERRRLAETVPVAGLLGPLPLAFLVAGLERPEPAAGS